MCHEYSNINHGIIFTQMQDIFLPLKFGAYMRKVILHLRIKCKTGLCWAKLRYTLPNCADKTENTAMISGISSDVCAF
jgi:hypothetical protein